MVHYLRDLHRGWTRAWTWRKMAALPPRGQRGAVLMNSTDVNYFILVAADADISRLAKPSAYEIALYRLGRRKWGLNEMTRNRKVLKEADKVLIYASGQRQHGMSFVGHATVAQSCRPAILRERAELDAPNGQGRVLSNFFIGLRDVVIFERPVDIRQLKHRLEFIRHPDSPKWAMPLVGGARRIEESDFQTVLSAASERPSFRDGRQAEPIR